MTEDTEKRLPLRKILIFFLRFVIVSLILYAAWVFIGKYYTLMVAWGAKPLVALTGNTLDVERTLLLHWNGQRGAVRVGDWALDQLTSLSIARLHEILREINFTSQEELRAAPRLLKTWQTIEARTLPARCENFASVLCRATAFRSKSHPMI